MTSVELIIHLDSADGDAVWWGESPQAPGFTAAASSLAEMRELAVDGLRDMLGDVTVVERLEGTETQTDPWGRTVHVAVTPAA